ncbi:hypothetical protein GBA52_002954 [Prunus armeniaca]|nr:hypothetical protein GBA52_002954 [Prunus armeniaca]
MALASVLLAWPSILKFLRCIVRPHKTITRSKKLRGEVVTALPPFRPSSHSSRESYDTWWLMFCLCFNGGSSSDAN